MIKNSMKRTKEDDKNNATLSRIHCEPLEPELLELEWLKPPPPLLWTRKLPARKVCGWPTLRL